MLGLVPSIHAFLGGTETEDRQKKVVDGRHKADHDDPV
jgi:hypothetical protein